MKVSKLLEWESTDGKQKAILLIEDPQKQHNDIEQRWIEISSYNSSEDKWETEETIDYIEEILDFGFPESLLD